jgi:outer membrane protein assembly factor BamB
LAIAFASATKAATGSKNITIKIPTFLKGEVDVLTSTCDGAGVTLSSKKLPATVDKVRMGSSAYYAGVSEKDKVLKAEIKNDKLELIFERAGKDYSVLLNSRPHYDYVQPKSFFTPDGKEGWVVHLDDDGPIQTPTYDSGVLYVGGGKRGNKFYAIDCKSGNQIWSYTTYDGDVAPTACVVEGGLVVFNTAKGMVYGLDAKTGKLVWHTHVEGELSTLPACMDGRVYIACPGCTLACLDLRSGNLFFKKSAICPFPEKPEVKNPISAPVLEGGAVYIASESGKTYCFDAASGKVIWMKKLSNNTAPLVANGQVLLSDRLGIPEGVTAWGYEGERPALSNRSLLTMAGTVIRANEAETGKRLWSADLWENVDRGTISAPSLGRENIYFSSSKGHLLSIRRSDGKINFCYATGQKFDSQPCLAEGTLYIATVNGDVLSLHVGDDAEDWYAWGGDSSHDKLK